MSDKGQLLQRLERVVPLEGTEMFDGVDRWKIAERFNVNKIHGKTRVQIYNAVAGGRPSDEFQTVMRDIAGLHPDVMTRLQKLQFVNFDDFASDHSADDPNRKDEGFGSLQPLADTQRWLRDVIAKHCPFVGPSMHHGRLWMTVARGEQANGEPLMALLRDARDTFRQLSPEGDRNKLLNAMLVVVPDMPKKPRFMSPREYLGQYRQDFGEECGTGITVGSFVPSEPVSAIADPLRVAPATFVLRHTIPKQAAHPHRHLPEHNEEAMRPF